MVFPIHSSASTDCPNPVCCRANDTGTIPAGKWGDYHCDLTEYMLNATLQQVSTLDVDFVVWTGDNPPHDVWEESPELQMKRIEEVTAFIAHFFPDTPVYPALGTSTVAISYCW